MNAHPNSTWKDLYHAAIHESDLNKLPERITDAEIAVVRELFYTSDYRIGEEESLDEAMCILHALRSSPESGLVTARPGSVWMDAIKQVRQNPIPPAHRFSLGERGLSHFMVC